MEGTHTFPSTYRMAASLLQSWCGLYIISAVFPNISSSKRMGNCAGQYSNCTDTQVGVQLQPPLPLDENVRQAAQKHLEQRYLELTPEQVSGPTHKAGHITRSIFINTSLWNEPAMAPTAVVPTLPEKRGAECGYQQLELGDEEQLARYPVLQAIRSGIKLDAESYTRGSYQTVPIVPGAYAFDLVVLCTVLCHPCCAYGHSFAPKSFSSTTLAHNSTQLHTMAASEASRY